MKLTYVKNLCKKFLDFNIWFSFDAHLKIFVLLKNGEYTIFGISTTCVKDLYAIFCLYILFMGSTVYNDPKTVKTLQNIT